METPNGVDGTVGGRFIPSGLPLAQYFTHEPACQTGERAPQGRFRHQPEQMVHPPCAWQLVSFPSLPVCGEEPRIPTGIFPGNQGAVSHFCLPPSVPGIVTVVGGMSRIIKEYSSGDVEDRPAITMALLTTRVRG